MVQKTVLVTGGCGFVGRNLIPILKNKGWCVRVLDNFSRGSREALLGMQVEVIEGDIREQGQHFRGM